MEGEGGEGPRLRDTPLEYKWLLIKPEATETEGAGYKRPSFSSEFSAALIESGGGAVARYGGREFDQLEIGFLLA